MRREHNLVASMVARWRQEYDLQGNAAFTATEPTVTEGCWERNRETMNSKNGFEDLDWSNDRASPAFQAPRHLDVYDMYTA